MSPLAARCSPTTRPACPNNNSKSEQKLGLPVHFCQMHVPCKGMFNPQTNTGGNPHPSNAPTECFPSEQPLSKPAGSVKVCVYVLLFHIFYNFLKHRSLCLIPNRFVLTSPRASEEIIGKKKR